MIKEYFDGESFINDNKEYLNINKYISLFFFLDAPLITEINSKNYVIKVKANGKTLLALKAEKYNTLLYGEKELLGEFLEYVKNKQYDINGIMCSIDIGRLLNKSEYIKSIGMDFMEAIDYTEESSNLVSIPNHKDVDEIYNMTISFLKDCGLDDNISKEKIAMAIDNYRIIRINETIVSMAMYSKNDEDSDRITYVFTKKEYRGCGYARKIVNCIKNEILSKGKIATLNVDQKNPISNHIYKSIGFKKVFSHGVYNRKTIDTNK